MCYSGDFFQYTFSILYICFTLLYDLGIVPLEELGIRVNLLCDNFITTVFP